VRPGSDSVRVVHTCRHFMHAFCSNPFSLWPANCIEHCQHSLAVGAEATERTLKKRWHFQMRANSPSSFPILHKIGSSRRRTKERLENGHKSKYTRIRYQEHNCLRYYWSSEAEWAGDPHLPTLQEDSKRPNASDHLWSSLLQGMCYCIHQWKVRFVHYIIASSSGQMKVDYVLCA